MASYLTTLAVGQYQKETATGPRGIPLTYWYRQGPDDKALPYLRRSPQYLQWLEQRFGPYPFDSAGVLMVPSASGMETQDRASFIAFVNQHTGKDFTSLVNTWLDSPTTPK